MQESYDLGGLDIDLTEAERAYLVLEQVNPSPKPMLGQIIREIHMICWVEVQSNDLVGFGPSQQPNQPFHH